MRQINDEVVATKEMTFYVPAFHVVKPGDKGLVENTHPDGTSADVSGENVDQNDDRADGNHDDSADDTFILCLHQGIPL